MADTSLEMASTMDYQRFPMSTHVNMKYNDEEIDITGTYDRRQNSQNGKLKIIGATVIPIRNISHGWYIQNQFSTIL
jgi:hypothetical protein